VSDLPGSFLALSIWILGSFVLRWILQSTVGGTSIYGPLAAPIAVLMWLYMTAIAVLIGAALNAVVDRLWPHKAHVAEVQAAAAHPGQDSDEDAEVEPVMKAEPERHHEHPHSLTPVESDERPEAEAARKIERLAGPMPERKPAPNQEPRRAPKPEAKPGPKAPAVDGEPEAVRKPASVGKSGAQSDTDDLG
jgi:membrane protein